MAGGFRLAGTPSAFRIALRILVPLLLVGAIWQTGIWRVTKTKRHATRVIDHVSLVSAAHCGQQAQIALTVRLLALVAYATMNVL